MKDLLSVGGVQNDFPNYTVYNATLMLCLSSMQTVLHISVSSVMKCTVIPDKYNKYYGHCFILQALLSPVFSHSTASLSASQSLRKTVVELCDWTYVDNVLLVCC